MFHDHDKFNTLTKANATLQAILAGDEIMNFIMPLSYAYGATGRIYTLAFCVMFIVCIHNVLIFIIGEAFKIEAEIEEKSLHRRKPKDRSLMQTSVISAKVNEERHTLISRAGNSLACKEVYQDEQIVEGDENIGYIKKKIFNKIIPQSRDTHIIHMLMKKDIIKNDIHYMKQSMQDLAREKLGKIYLFQTSRSKNR